MSPARTPRTGEPSLRLIYQLTAGYYGFRYVDLISDRKVTALRKPRFAAAWLAGRLTSHSWTAIGRAMGGRDHSTVVHQHARATAAAAADPSFAADLATLEKACGAAAEAAARLKVTSPLDLDPLAVAERVLAGEIATQVSLDELLALASAVKAALAPITTPTEEEADGERIAAS